MIVQPVIPPAIAHSRTVSSPARMLPVQTERVQVQVPVQVPVPIEVPVYVPVYFDVYLDQMQQPNTFDFERKLPPDQFVKKPPKVVTHAASEELHHGDSKKASGSQEMTTKTSHETHHTTKKINRSPSVSSSASSTPSSKSSAPSDLDTDREIIYVYDDGHIVQTQGGKSRVVAPPQLSHNVYLQPQAQTHLTVPAPTTTHYEIKQPSQMTPGHTQLQFNNNPTQQKPLPLKTVVIPEKPTTESKVVQTTLPYHDLSRQPSFQEPSHQTQPYHTVHTPLQPTNQVYHTQRPPQNLQYSLTQQRPNTKEPPGFLDRLFDSFFGSDQKKKTNQPRQLQNVNPTNSILVDSPRQNLGQTRSPVQQNAVPRQTGPPQVLPTSPHDQLGKTKRYP